MISSVRRSLGIACSGRARQSTVIPTIRRETTDSPLAGRQHSHRGGEGYLFDCAAAPVTDPSTQHPALSTDPAAAPQTPRARRKTPLIQALAACDLTQSRGHFGTPIGVHVASFWTTFELQAARNAARRAARPPPSVLSLAVRSARLRSHEVIRVPRQRFDGRDAEFADIVRCAVAARWFAKVLSALPQQADSDREAPQSMAGQTSRPRQGWRMIALRFEMTS